MTVSRRLVDAIQGEEHANELAALTRALTAVKGGGHDLAAIVAKRLTRAIQAEGNPEGLAALERAFAAGSGSPDQAATVLRRLVDAIQAQADPARLRSLSIAFRETAKRVGKSQSEALALQLAQAIHHEENADRLVVLSDAFATVGSVTPGLAPIITLRLTHEIEQRSNSGQYESLVRAFGNVAASTGTVDTRSVFRSVAHSLEYEVDTDNPKQTCLRFLSYLPDPLDSSDLANVLKYPNCIGKFHSAVVKRLATERQDRSSGEGRSLAFLRA